MKKREPWLLMLPALVPYALFSLFPIVMTFVGSVVELGAYGEGWIGLRAWREVLANPIFTKATMNTVMFTVVLFPITMVLSLLLAVVLSWARRGLRAFARVAFYVPGVTSAMMISVIVRWALAPNGLVNKLLGTDILFLGSNPAAFWSICGTVVLITIGSPLIYLMAAFALIDPELYEAARLDGCNRMQEAIHVTVPGIMPVIVFLGVGRLSGLVQIWQLNYAMTGGGPNYGTVTLMLLTYQEAVIHGRLSHASVLSVLLVVVVGILTWISQKLAKQRVIE